MKALARKPTAERRAEIAQTALRIIGERGVTALTTAALAEEIGVTSGALFRHFASIDEILVEAARYGVERIRTTFATDTLSPKDRLLDTARARISLLGSNRGLDWLLRSDQARLILPSEAVEVLTDFVRSSKEFLERAVREAASEGSIRTDIKPEAVLVIFMGTVHALIGMQGVHKAATKELGKRPKEVLDALMLVLEPTETIEK